MTSDRFGAYSSLFALAKGEAIDHRLVIIEGIAGSGKSVIGQRLYRTAHLNNIPVVFYHEFHRPHPVLEATAASVSAWIEQSEQKWRQFTDSASRLNSVVILDGALFQCGAGELLERDADRQAIESYAHTIGNVIRETNPVIIHLYQKDMGAALRKVYEQRPRSWASRVETFLAETAFGSTRTASGFDLYHQFNRELRRISDNLFDTLDITGLAIDSTECLWDDYLERICAFLKLEQPPDPFRPGDYCGNYINGQDDRRCHLAVVENTLRVEGLFNIEKSLLPKMDDTLFVQTWPDELTFVRDDRDRVASFRSTGPWNRLGDDTWTRLEST